jgi:hypothetical protein
MITPAQVDKLIKNGSTVTIKDKYGDSGTVKFVRREGRTVYCEDGAAFDRTDIDVIK